MSVSILTENPSFHTTENKYYLTNCNCYNSNNCNFIAQFLNANIVKNFINAIRIKYICILSGGFSKRDKLVINICLDEPYCVIMVTDTFTNTFSLKFWEKSQAGTMISMTYLIAVGMTPNDDTLGPAWYKTGNVLADDSFPKYSAAEYITDCPVR